MGCKHNRDEKALLLESFVDFQGDAPPLVISSGLLHNQRTLIGGLESQRRFRKDTTVGFWKGFEPLKAMLCMYLGDNATTYRNYLLLH